MTLDQAWLDLMPVTITAYPRSAVDAYGQSGYSSTARGTYKARIEPDTRRQVSDSGRESVQRHRIITEATTITILDRIVYGGANYVIEDLRTEYDEAGVHHQELVIAPGS
jgi:hypothetical protein